MVIIINDVNKKPFANVRYTKITTGQFSDEVVVQLDTEQQSIVGIFPSHFIDKKRGTVRAVLVQESDNAYLVDLPNTTFTTSSKVWFPKGKVVFEAGLP
jgi:hypothetical protein